MLSKNLPEWVQDEESILNRVEIYSDPTNSLDHTIGKGIFTVSSEFEERILFEPEWLKFQEHFGINRYFFGFSFSILPKGVNYGKHIDQPSGYSQTYTVSLNIPILNCEDSKIEHYELSGDAFEHYKSLNNIEIQSSKKDEFKLLSSTEINNQIYSLRTDIIHDIITNHEKTRVVLACRLNKDIIPTIESLGVD